MLTEHATSRSIVHARTPRYPANQVVWLGPERLQSSCAISTSEAEFNALADMVRNTSWVRAVLTDLEQPQNSPTMVNQDNLRSISWTEEVQGLQNVKHIGIEVHIVQGMVSKRSAAIKYMASQDNRADGFTKVLVDQQF